MSSSGSLSSAIKLKEEGNKMFMKRNYKEAIDLYTKAIEKCSSSALNYTNRALCYFKLSQWSATIEDCRRAAELDPNSVKAYFFMGQALGELGHYDEAIVQLKRAHELTRELHENYGDEITRTIRNAKRRRWQCIEEKRVKQEIELHAYLNRLMLEDKQRQIAKLTGKEKQTTVTTTPANTEYNSLQNSNDLDSIVSTQEPTTAPILAASTIENGTDKEEKRQLNEIEAEFQQRSDDLARLFNENDVRRRKREIPDFLCGKI